MAKFTNKSPFAKEATTMEFPNLTQEEFDTLYGKWAAGEGSVQQIFSMLDADEREFIMSGLTPAC
tara:strand:+ start:4751 stop:4945 length:195 start_codon:yes stop_codon:yes gene_type:complete